ncbi:HpcH/HpaI aldolase family protein [Ruegeria sp. MALMAid1280]|uniref:HpcH/HpaI aldolase family protein n=1 Tax=Ruegeria sp. MALMAid1280 TaxID=3411634 RepID=UPI003BA08C02
MSPNARFRTALHTGEQLVGCFIKTPHPTVIEVLGDTELDFLVLDGEHSPFDKASINTCMLAAKAVGKPILIRVPDDNPAFILNVLDCGAAGVVVPHVVSVEQAERLARSMRYVPGGRGIAGTTRAGGYGAKPLPQHRADADAEVSLICQIEDREGVENAGAIAAVDGVDALFVGRADLTVSYGLTDFNDAGVAEKAADVLGVKGAATGLFVSPAEDMGSWRDKGASFYLSGSDHSLLFAGAKTLAARKPD